MKIKEKMGNFMEEHGSELIVCGGMILAYAVGVTVGKTIAVTKISSGLAQVFLEDPEIQILMDTAIENLKSKNK